MPEAVGVPDRHRRGAPSRLERHVARARQRVQRRDGAAQRRRARSSGSTQQLEPALVEAGQDEQVVDRARSCRSTSSRALSSTRRAAVGRASARRLTSISERIAASGVRSSWEASATSRCCSSMPSSMRSSIAFSVRRQMRDLVAGARNDQAVARSGGGRSPPRARSCGRSGAGPGAPATSPPSAVASSAAGPAIRSRTRPCARSGRSVAVDSAATATCRCPRSAVGRATQPEALAAAPELGGPGQLCAAQHAGARRRASASARGPPDRRTTPPRAPTGPGSALPGARR